MGESVERIMFEKEADSMKLREIDTYGFVKNLKGINKVDSDGGFLQLPMWTYVLNEVYEIKDITPIIISKRTYITYSHITKVVKQLEIYGYIKSSREKRSKVLRLTKKGQIFSKKIHDIIYDLREYRLRTLNGKGD